MFIFSLCIDVKHGNTRSTQLMHNTELNAFIIIKCHLYRAGLSIITKLSQPIKNMVGWQ